jgi:hypothetical protein
VNRLFIRIRISPFKHVFVDELNNTHMYILLHIDKENDRTVNAGSGRIIIMNILTVSDCINSFEKC